MAFRIYGGTGGDVRQEGGVVDSDWSVVCVVVYIRHVHSAITYGSRSLIAGHNPYFIRDH